MTNDMWLGVFRHLLTVAGGVFVAKGYADADTVNAAIGATTTLGGIVWSVLDKKSR
jgi:hypothetical protein